MNTPHVLWAHGIAGIRRRISPFIRQVLSPATSRPDLVATICDKVIESRVESRAALWRVPGAEMGVGGDVQNGDLDEARLLKLLDFDTSSYGLSPTAALWHPAGEDKCVTLVDDRVVLNDVSVSGDVGSIAAVIGASAVDEKTAGGKSHLNPRSKLTTGEWNPHHNSTTIATANDNHIRGWDLRSMKTTWAMENAHAQLIRDLDFNPNKQYVIASCGDDCKAKFWDVRKTNEPLLVIAQHSHWIWSIKYNNFHDQLLLTSSR